MLDLIIAILISWGYPAETGKHFIMNSEKAYAIQSDPNYKPHGGDREFYNYVEVKEIDDVILTDDAEPPKQ